jgi:hypothetical protein
MYAAACGISFVLSAVFVLWRCPLFWECSDSDCRPSTLSVISVDGTKGRIGSPPPFYILNPDDYRSYFPSEGSFQVGKRVAPFLDLPSDHYENALKAYYYRIRSYRKHIRKTDDDRFWIVTEFTPIVPWAGASNTISGAAGHHILEGRWFWDAPQFVSDYVRFWYIGGGDNGAVTTRTRPQPHIATYTNWIYHTTIEYVYLWGIHDPRILQLLRDTLPQAASVFREMYVNKYLTNSSRNEPLWNTTKRICWTQDDGYDAMEVSVSGGGCRPTIAAAMWGEAQALVSAAVILMNSTGMQMDTKLERIIHEFSNWATFSKNVILQQHWNPNIESFAVIPPPRQRKKVFVRRSTRNDTPFNQRCDLGAIRTPNRPVNVRELLAFMPWYYSSLLTEEDSTYNISELAHQFRFLLDSTEEDGFTATWGLRTVQKSTPCYNYSWEHGDCWNGPSWPFETSRVLTAVANLLSGNSDAVTAASGMSADAFERLFLQYSRQHTKTTAENDTAHPLGSGHVFENIHPDLGYWNNRAQMYWRNDTGNKDMGDDYNHSTYLDLIFASWIGIRLSASRPYFPWLVLQPLIRASYFAADRIPYKGRVLSVVYDPSGDRYRTTNGAKLQGFVVLLEGEIVAQRPCLGPVVIENEPSRVIYR